MKINKPRKNPEPSLRYGLAASQHPFGDGLHYAKALANQRALTHLLILDI